MEPSQQSHATELSSYLWRNARWRPDDKCLHDAAPALLLPVRILCPAFLSSGPFSVTFCSCRRSSHSTYQNCYNLRPGFIRTRVLLLGTVFRRTLKMELWLFLFSRNYWKHIYLLRYEQLHCAFAAIVWKVHYKYQFQFNFKVWLHTALSCNHQLFACPSYNLDVWLLRYPNLRPWSQGWRLQVSLDPWDNNRASWSSVAPTT